MGRYDLAKGRSGRRSKTSAAKKTASGPTTSAVSLESEKFSLRRMATALGVPDAYLPDEDDRPVTRIPPVRPQPDGYVPRSLLLTIRGPNGYHVSIPLRDLVSTSVWSGHGEGIMLGFSGAAALQNDIEAARRRLGMLDTGLLS